MPLQATSGAASYDAFGGGVPAGPATYIEDVFSCFLYAGNGTFSGETNVITNNIDLSTKGGMVWIKNRTSAATENCVSDTVRGGTSKMISTNSTAAQAGSGSNISFQTTGFTALTSGVNTNYTGENYVSWTFRKQPKFFDVVTYTGTGSNTTIAHSLGSVPGCIIVKRTDTAGYAWAVYHRGLGTPASNFLFLNTTDATQTGTVIWNNTNPTSSVFTVGGYTDVNASGGTYVAYLFAHDAGGFGLTGTDNVISCGSVVGASQVEVNLGYEPQWILVKNASAAQDWWLVDNMRGLPVQNTSSAYNASNLRPNLSDAETTGFSIAPSATGFKANVLTSGQTYIYIAIRRGPMKVPTTGTSVYNAVSRTGTDATATINSVITPDLWLIAARSGDSQAQTRIDRLRGDGRFLNEGTDAESTTSAAQLKITNGMTSVSVGSGATWNASASTFINWFFRRAPSFFDEVCYTGTGSYPFTINHNLGVAPELMIIKPRNAAQSWWTYAKPVTSPNSNWYQNYFVLNGTQSSTSDLTSFTSAPTSTTIPVADYYAGSGTTYVAYLFATCAGVSKVGSYTGTGALQTVNCGFTSGARFVLIKRTDSTGDWWTYDSARGITSGNDPYLFLNSTAAEVTGTNYVDTDSTGFKVTASAPAGLNANGGTYIFLAIA